MKNKNLKNALIKFNQMEISKVKSMEILNPDELNAIKGGLSDIDCRKRFKIKCTNNFSIGSSLEEA